MKNNLQKEIIKVVEKLISFRSTEFYPQQKEDCLNFIENYFKGTGVFINKIINKNCTAILISNADSKYLDLLLNGHIDVVEGPGNLFVPRKTGNRLYGRGAIDMKASVAVMMVIMKKIAKEKINKKITLMIVGDEEIPGPKSTQYLIKKFNLKPKFTIIGEETGFDIVTEQKGNLSLKIKAFGKSAHSAFPEKGINAIEKCLRFYESIADLKCFQENIAYNNTIALTYLRSGQSINSIPDICEMGINIRFVGEKDLQKILNFTHKHQKVDFSIEVYHGGPGMKNVGGKKEVQKLRDISQSIEGIKTKITKTATGSDAKYFSQRNLPVIMFGPKGAGYHGNEEYVEIKSLINYYKILYEFINQ